MGHGPTWTIHREIGACDSGLSTQSNLLRFELCEQKPALVEMPSELLFVAIHSGGKSQLVDVQGTCRHRRLARSAPYAPDMSPAR